MTGDDRRCPGAGRPCTDFTGLIRATVAISVAIRTHYDLRSIWNFS